MADPVQIYAQLTAAFNRRNWSEVRASAAQLLSLAPRHPAVRYMVGIACMELGDLPSAIEHLRLASSLEPASAEFSVQYAKALSLARRGPEAQAVADHALCLAPGDPGTLDTLGVIYTQTGDYAAAAKVFRQAVAVAPEHAPFRYNLATSLVAAGEIDAAEIQLEACLDKNPQHWLAHLTLAQLRRQTPDSQHIARLEACLSEVEAGKGDAEGLMCLNMALAKEHEDLGDYARSFTHLSRGKAAGGLGRTYSIEQDEALFKTIMDSFVEEPIVSDGYASEEPIFIIGMPRTGTTLVERIISSHPDVKSAGEMLNFGMALKQLSGSRGPALIDIPTIIAARDLDWSALGASYLRSTRPATGTTPRFIDKLPHNFLYAGHIARALPKAKIICLRRNPMDTCLSNFRQLFGNKSPYFGYSFDLLDTGRYYLLFDQLMSHWQQTFPGRILELDYESLVDSQESSSRQLLQHCGLAWHDDCLTFERNASPVATASAVQVRKPMFRTSLRRWKHYEKELAELRSLLQDSGIEVFN